MVLETNKVSYQPSAQRPTSSSSPSAATTTAQSSKSTRNSKLDHIVQNFYTKTAQLIIQARFSDTLHQDLKKLNKWFNLSTEDISSLRDELRYWRTRAIQSVDTEPPPMTIDIYLDTSRLTQKQTLTVLDDNLASNKVNLFPSQTDTTYAVKRIVLEKWVLTLNHPLPHHPVDLPNLYKRSIVFFRSLYSLVRLLPSHSLYQQLSSFNHTNDISIGYQFSTQNIQRHDQIPLESSILPQHTAISTKILNDITTPLGTFKLHVSYRRNCDFRVDDFNSSTRPTIETYRHRPYSMYDTRLSLLAGIAQGKDLHTVLPKSSFSTDNRHSRTADPRYPTLPKPLTISPATSSPISRPISSPIFSPFKSPSLSSSPQAENLVSGFKNASATDPPRSNDDSQASSSGFLGRKVEFSSSFEKYKGSPNRMDPGNTKRSHTINTLVDPNLEEFIRMVGGTNDLKLWQDSSIKDQPLSFSIVLRDKDPGSVLQSKKDLDHYETMRKVHHSLTEHVHSSIKELHDDAGRSHLPTNPSPLHTEQLLHHSVRGSRTHKWRQTDQRRFDDDDSDGPASMADDDDSLVFKMSELGGDIDASLSPPILFNRAQRLADSTQH